MRDIARKDTGRRIKQAFVLNFVGAVLIALVFVVIALSALLAAEEELEETSLQTARTWVDATLAGRIEMSNVMAGEDIDRDDLAYLRTAALGGGILYFSIHGPDGALRLNATMADPDADFASGRQPHPILPDWIVPQTAMDGETAVEIVRNANGAVVPGAGAMPAIMATAFVPVIEAGDVIGIAGVVLDQTDAAAIFSEEARNAILFSAILAGLALLTSTATGYLLLAQRRSEARIQFMALHDPLTGVGNRNLFNCRLNEAIRRAQGGGGMIALHLVDLDKFKAVNDTLGHDAGDALLREVCTQVQSHIRAGDLLARLGGDEFAVIQQGIKEPSQVRAMAERLVAAVREIENIDEVPIGVSASVGVATLPANASTLADLQKCADIALYRAKEHGRNQAVVYEDGMDEDLRVRNMLRMLLRRSTEAESFELHYQPIHDSRTGALTGFEALLRLATSSEEPILPGVFIPVAEEMGLTPRIGAWVLREACLAASHWPSGIVVSVNLSAQQFEADIVHDVREALRASGLDPSRLELEITESLFVREPTPFIDKLHNLKALGVRIVMDDFGTGYSSLNYLWMFPFDKIKVDRSCFKSLDQNEKVAEILRTISALGTAMQVRVTAEGVETEAQRDFAARAGYDEIQGFLYSRPMPMGSVSGYIDGVSRGGAASARALPRHEIAGAGPAALAALRRPAD